MHSKMNELFITFDENLNELNSSINGLLFNKDEKLWVFLNKIFILFNEISLLCSSFPLYSTRHFFLLSFNLFNFDFYSSLSLFSLLM